MYTKVVYRISDRKYKVESTDSIGIISAPTYYKSLNAMPTDVGNKVKLLMWTSPDDQTNTKDVGVRIGANIYWII